MRSSISQLTHIAIRHLYSLVHSYQMYSFNAIHWLAPTSMLVSLTGGLLFAVGHHIFYAALDRSHVLPGSYHVIGTTISKQQFNISLGTTFAFFVRIFLCYAVSVSYIQIFWRNVRHAKKQSTIAEINWAASGLQNVFHLVEVRHGWKHLTLLLLAIIFWLVFIHHKHGRN